MFAQLHGPCFLCETFDCRSYFWGTCHMIMSFVVLVQAQFYATFSIAVALFTLLHHVFDPDVNIYVVYT